MYSFVTQAHSYNEAMLTSPVVYWENENCATPRGGGGQFLSSINITPIDNVFSKMSDMGC